MKNKKTALAALHSVLLPIFVLMGIALNAQNCYVRLGGTAGAASGVAPNAGQVADLEAAACRLIDSLPANLRDSFKVMDISFYLHGGSTSGGYPEQFQKAIEEAQDSSKYYLLFGRQTGPVGTDSKFWVALQLPNWGIFYCIDQLSPFLRGDLTAKYGIIANAVHDANGNANSNYDKAEMAAIDSLQNYVTALKDCCIPPGQQRRGPSCTSCAFTATEFRLLLNNNGFAETKCTINSAISTTQGSNFINRLVTIDGELINVDVEIQQYIDMARSSNPSKSVSVYTFNYYEDCADLTLLLEEAQVDTACLVIVVGVVGNIGEEGAVFVKTFEETGCLIEPNGSGQIYVYDLNGIFKFEYSGNNYHGIYFTDSPFWLGRIDFKKNDSKGDAIAKWSHFFISDENIVYLKNMQKKCNENKREYGGLVSLGAKGELTFEECTWCSATSATLSNDVLDVRKYSNYNDKDFVSFWHTHPDDDEDYSQTPSGLRYLQPGESKTGDFYVFENQYFWQGSELGESICAKNTWQLPGRVGIIAGELGITIYRFSGDYYHRVGPNMAGVYPCSHHTDGYCYLRKGTNHYSQLLHTWINYDLSKKNE